MAINVKCYLRYFHTLFTMIINLVLLLNLSISLLIHSFTLEIECGVEVPREGKSSILHAPYN